MIALCVGVFAGAGQADGTNVRAAPGRIKPFGVVAAIGRGPHGRDRTLPGLGQAPGCDYCTIM
jgi:hypothetical protein